MSKEIDGLFVFLLITTFLLGLCNLGIGLIFGIVAGYLWNKGETK